MTLRDQKWKCHPTPNGLQIKTEDEQTRVTDAMLPPLAEHIVEAHNLWLSMNQPTSGMLTKGSATEIKLSAEQIRLVNDHQKLENMRLEAEIQALRIENETAALHLKKEQERFQRQEERTQGTRAEVGSSSSIVIDPLQESLTRLTSLERNLTLFQSWTQAAMLKVLESTMPSDEFHREKEYLKDLGSYVDEPLQRKQ